MRLNNAEPLVNENSEEYFSYAFNIFQGVKIFLILHQEEIFNIRLKGNSQNVAQWGFELHGSRGIAVRYPKTFEILFSWLCSLYDHTWLTHSILPLANRGKRKTKP